MKEIHIIFIIFILFLLYNYFFVYEGVTFEAGSYTKSINDLLTSNKWTNPQTFDKINVLGNDFVLGKSGNRGNCKDCRALVKNDNNTLTINFDNDFSGGTTIHSNLTLSDDKWFCIGDSCISKTDLQNIKDILSGKKNIYIYKANDYNKYLYSNGGVSYGSADDTEEQKKKYGSWRITNEIPKKQFECNSYSTSCSF